MPEISTEQQLQYQFYGTTQAAWQAMLESIRGAKKSIFWELYSLNDDAAGEEFISALCAKAQEGVEVRMVVDAIGSFELSRKAVERLRAAGVSFVWFNPLSFTLNIFKFFWRFMSRNHRKVLLVDEETGFLGGVNVSNIYREWPDLYVRLKGPALRPLLRAFAKSYVFSGGRRSDIARLLHPKLASLDDYRNRLKFLLHSSRFERASPAEQWYVQALAAAQETVHLISPYFVPSKKFLRALEKARARGVKVNLYLPERPDHKFMEVLARMYYRLAESAGADIFLLDHMHHGKAFTVDNKLGMVGSANLTPRSFWLNSEAGVLFSDEKMVASLNQIFNNLHERATPWREANIEEHSFFERIELWLLKKLEAYF
jgi:cardiolipin synthase